LDVEVNDRYEQEHQHQSKIFLIEFHDFP